MKNNTLSIMLCYLITFSLVERSFLYFESAYTIFGNFLSWSLLLLSILLLFIKIFIDSHQYLKFINLSFRTIFFILFFSLITLLTNNFYFDVVILSLAFLTFTINVFLNIFLKINILCLIIHICLYVSGVIEDNFTYRLDGTIRYSLGFHSPNTFSLIFITILSCFVLLITSKVISIIFSICCFSLSFIINIYTDCRTGYLICIILCISMLIEHNKRISFLLKKGSYYIYFALTIISLVLGIWFSKNVFINAFLSNRPYLWHQYLQYNILLVGNDFTSFSVDRYMGSNALDNAYLTLLLQQGLLLFLLIGYINYLLFNYIHNSRFYVVGIIFILYGLVENYAFFPCVNPLITCTFILFINERTINERLSQRNYSNL